MSKLFFLLNIMYNLHSDGFQVFRNAIPLDKVEYAKNQINSQVNYFLLKPFIDKELLGKANNLLGENLTCIKYRVSNNTNSSDAGSFHRDLQSYVKNETTPVFTTLTYLDPAVMQLIPKSFNNTEIPFTKINEFYKSKINIEMNPGDILIFYASTIHRGIFYKNRAPDSNRRLIQCFDCVKLSDLNRFQRSILHLPCGTNCSNIISKINIKLNKIYGVSEVLNIMGTITTAKGYGSFYGSPRKFTKDSEIKYLSTETNQDRLVPSGKDEFQTQNMYIHNTSNPKDILQKDLNTYYFYAFYLDGLIFLFLLTLLVVLIILLAKKIFVINTSKSLKRKRVNRRL
jgi:hypothetical protein